MSSGFFDRLVSRVDKLDPDSLQAQFVRLSQERGFLETIFQSIQEGVLVIDASARLLYANKAAETLTGQELKSLLGKSMLRLMHSWDWDHLLIPVSDAKGDTGWHSIVTREVEVSYPEHRFISISAMPLERSERVDGGVLFILRDISRERKQEASVLESERINAIKNLAAGLAHEIGNPLNALTIHLQLLDRQLNKLTDEAQRKSLQELTAVAESEIARLDSINRQFLGAIRPQKPVLRADQLDDVLKASLALLRTELENRRIEVTLAIPEKIPAVFLDRAQIEQVYFNLIKNAIEAMPDGGKLRIVFGVSDSSVEVSFIDTGCGIPQDELGQVFKPYHTTKAKGTGLGLMIVQRIITEHGGEVSIASKEGQGTCFRISLPRIERRIRQIPAGK